MAIVSHIHPFGVDTHARTHTFAILVANTGEQLALGTFPATTSSMSRAIDWAARRTGGDMHTLWVIEGIGTYGAGLARAAAADGYPVVEAPRMDARARRGTRKSDPIDARAIAAAVLPLDEQQLRRPRRDDGVRAALRVLVTAREQMTDERTANVNALTGLVRAVSLGIDARKALTPAARSSRSPVGAPAMRTSPPRLPAPKPSASPDASQTSATPCARTRPG